MLVLDISCQQSGDECKCCVSTVRDDEDGKKDVDNEGEEDTDKDENDQHDVLVEGEKHGEEYEVGEDDEND